MKIVEVVGVVEVATEPLPILEMKALGYATGGLPTLALALAAVLVQVLDAASSLVGLISDLRQRRTACQMAALAPF